MGVLMWVNVGLVAVNVVLTLAVALVYAKNYRQVRSSFTLGLLLFSLFLLVHNGFVLYHLLTMMAVFATLGEWLLLAENVLLLVALSALARATYR